MCESDKRHVAAARNLIAPAVFLGGLATACAGTALIYLPAGLITFGGTVAFMAAAYVRGTPEPGSDA